MEEFGYADLIYSTSSCKIYRIIFSQKELPKKYKLARILLVEYNILTGLIFKCDFVTIISGQIQEYYGIFITI
jgi:hypothetical protein